jgi:hypothetical protein
MYIDGREKCAKHWKIKFEQKSFHSEDQSGFDFFKRGIL